MNAKRFLPLVSPLLVAAPLAHAQVDCSKPGRVDYARACQEAAKGMNALRQFRDARRGIYAIDLRDFEHAVGKIAKEDDGKVKLAQAKDQR